jgi:hypothetical protein
MGELKTAEIKPSQRLKVRRQKPTGVSTIQARESLGRVILRDFMNDFYANGKKSIERLREENPAAYVALGIKLSGIEAIQQGNNTQQKLTITWGNVPNNNNQTNEQVIEGETISKSD